MIAWSNIRIGADARIVRAWLVACFVLCLPLSAADRGRATIQDTPAIWSSKDGIPGPVLAIAQTQDGYLQIGTEAGLYQLDGLQCVPWEPTHQGHFPDASAMSLRTTDFVVPPMFKQSSLFRVLCVSALIGLVWFAYRFRTNQITGQLKKRLCERAAERETIARDLHDTFFQSIQGLLLQFNTATHRLQSGHPARAMFEEALQQSDQVMAEGRALLMRLHAAASKANDLPTELASYGAQLQEGRTGDFEIIVNGTIRPLHPIILEELCRIGKEALGNAFRHSMGRSIEVELNYEPDELRICIRDDGAGIDPNILKDGGRDGHLGLLSMRERATNIGAQLDIWSRIGVGTEIEARVPASLAYALVQEGFFKQSLRKFWRRRHPANSRLAC